MINLITIFLYTGRDTTWKMSKYDTKDYTQGEKTTWKNVRMWHNWLTKIPSNDNDELFQFFHVKVLTWFQFLSYQTFDLKVREKEKKKKYIMTWKKCFFFPTQHSKLHKARHITLSCSSELLHIGTSVLQALETAWLSQTFQKCSLVNGKHLLKELDLW